MTRVRNVRLLLERPLDRLSNLRVPNNLTDTLSATLSALVLAEVGVPLPLTLALNKALVETRRIPVSRPTSRGLGPCPVALHL